MGYFYFFIYRCNRRVWVPSFVKGPEWKTNHAAEQYSENLAYYSGQTEEPYTVNTWRHSGRPGDQWQDLGWSQQSCP